VHIPLVLDAARTNVVCITLVRKVAMANTVIIALVLNAIQTNKQGPGGKRCGGRHSYMTASCIERPFNGLDQIVHALYQQAGDLA
jgi:hypothetical protein